MSAHDELIAEGGKPAQAVLEKLRMPIGSLVGGWLATFDLRMPFWVAGGFGVLVAVASVRFLARIK